MSRIKASVITLVVAVVAGLPGHVVEAKPACHQRVHCGASCEGTSAGGFCLGAVEPPAYCYQESVTIGDGGYVYSCHWGSYDYCCDEEYPY